MRFKNNNQLFFWSIFSLSLVVILFIFFNHPIHQDLSYHNFAEKNHVGIIPHFTDVITNLSFGFVGIFLFLRYRNNKEYYGAQKKLFYSFCFSACALCIGSGFYHWNPNNYGLLFDRITMLLGFALIFLDTTIRYKIFSHTNLCTKILTVEFLFLVTLVPWIRNDRLELYIFAQFFVMSVMPLLAIKNFTEGGNQYKHILMMFLFYSLAKFFEFYDYFFYQLIHISGHSIKHICYAFSLYYFGKDILKKDR